MDLRQEFNQAVESALTEYEALIDRTATRTREMYESYGCWIAVLEKLVISHDEQQGFKTLKKNGRLDISFEQLIIDYKELFSEHAITYAQSRLDGMLS